MIFQTQVVRDSLQNANAHFSINIWNWSDVKILTVVDSITYTNIGSILNKLMLS
jgi:hypothetical protein